MDCMILKNCDPMIGVDLHGASPTVALPPGGAAALPPSPHFTAALLMSGIWGASTGKGDRTVRNVGMTTMVVGTDIGKGIPHIPSNIPYPNARAFLLPLTSSSASNFGVSTVLTGQGPVAVALAVTTNINVNCADNPFVPSPGIVMANTTNFAGMTLGDVLAGLLRTVYSLVTGWAIGKVADLAQEQIKGGLQKAIASNLSKRLGTKLLAETLKDAVQQATKESLDAAMAKEITKTLLSIGTKKVVTKGYSILTEAIIHILVPSTKPEKPDKPPSNDAKSGKKPRKPPPKDADWAAEQAATAITRYVNDFHCAEYPTTPPATPYRLNPGT